jgi:hypothetical protein
MISLIELLKTKNIPLDNYKIHLATGKKPTPLEAFLEGKFKEWQDTQNNKNFECDYVLSLINLEEERWLFAGVYRILGVSFGTSSPFLYQTELLPNQEDVMHPWNWTQEQNKIHCVHKGVQNVKKEFHGRIQSESSA